MLFEEQRKISNNSLPRTFHPKKSVQETTAPILVISVENVRSDLVQAVHCEEGERKHLLNNQMVRRPNDDQVGHSLSLWLCNLYTLQAGAVEQSTAFEFGIGHLCKATQIVYKYVGLISPFYFRCFCQTTILIDGLVDEHVNCAYAWSF